MILGITSKAIMRGGVMSVGVKAITGAILVLLLSTLALGYLSYKFKEENGKQEVRIEYLTSEVEAYKMELKRNEDSRRIERKIQADLQEQLTTVSASYNTLLQKHRKLRNEAPVTCPIPIANQRLLDDAYCLASPSDPYCTTRE